MLSFKLPNMFVAGFFNFTLEDGPLTRDVEVLFVLMKDWALFVLVEFHE